MTFKKSHTSDLSQSLLNNWDEIAARLSLSFQEWNSLSSSLSNICENLAKPLNTLNSESLSSCHYLEQINKSIDSPGLKNLLRTSEPPQRFLQLFQKVSEIDRQLFQSDLDQTKFFRSLEASVAKSFKPLSEANAFLNAIANRPIKLLTTPRTEELFFILRKLESCKAYLGKIDSRTPLQDILEALEGVPEDEYEEVLISNFGRSKRRVNARKLKREAKKLFNCLLYFYSLYTFLTFIGIPLPATFPEFIEVIFQQPVQSIQQTKQYPPISKGFDKQLLVASSRKRKKRSNKRRRK